MQRLQRYVGWHVLAAVLMVSAVLLGLFAAVMFADKMGDMGDAYPMSAVLMQVALGLPEFVVVNMGFAMLIGCLLGLGVLANQSELTVMRASGVSVLRIVSMVLRPMLLLIVLTACLSEFFVPKINRYADSLLQQAEENEQGWFDSGKGLWLRQHNDFLHFNRILPNGDIYGLARFAFSTKGELLSVLYSPHAVFEKQSPGKSNTEEQKSHGTWQLQRARETRFMPDNVSAKSIEHETRWSTPLAPTLLRVVVDEPQRMNLSELHRYINYLNGQGQNSTHFELAFWQKTLQPLAMLGLVIVAIAFVFGPMRTSTMGYRLFAGVMLGIGFRFLQDLLGPISLVYDFSPLLAVLLPIAACWMVGIILLLQTK